MHKRSAITSLGTTTLVLGLLAAVSFGAHAAPKDRHDHNTLVLGDGPVTQQRLAETRQDRGEARGFENVKKDFSDWQPLAAQGRMTAETR